MTNIVVITKEDLEVMIQTAIKSALKEFNAPAPIKEGKTFMDLNELKNYLGSRNRQFIPGYMRGQYRPLKWERN